MVKMYETTKENILFVEISSLPVPRASRILIVSDEYMYVFVCYLLHLLLANSASTTIEDTQSHAQQLFSNQKLWHWLMDHGPSKYTNTNISSFVDIMDAWESIDLYVL